MTEARERLALLEGIIIGIYGNWLVSLIDHISFTKFYQTSVLVLSFGTFITAFFVNYIKPDIMTRKVLSALFVLHLVSNAVLLVEEATFKIMAFYTIGVFLLVAVAVCERERMRIT